MEGEWKPHRLYFSTGNPWPEGHSLRELSFYGLLYGEGLLELRIRLKTVDYCENDGGDRVEDRRSGAWCSKSAWNNYRSCLITGSLDEGVIGDPVSIDRLENSEYCIDPLPGAYQDLLDDELSFEIYLIGHDSVADHRIKLGPLNSEGYTMKWSGRIALTYSGRDEFEHSFYIESTLPRLQRIEIAKGVDKERVFEVLPLVLTEHERFVISRSGECLELKVG